MNDNEKHQMVSCQMSLSLFKSQQMFDMSAEAVEQWSSQTSTNKAENVFFKEKIIQ